MRNLYTHYRKKNITRTFLLASLFLITVFPALADGTKQVSPTNTADGAALYIDPAGGNGNYFNAPSSQRLQFTIVNNATENLYFGMHPRTFSNTNTTLVTNAFYRILNSSGTVVAGPTAVPTTGTGFISTWAQANAGPNIGGATPAGYTPLMFDPTANGDYYVEIYRSNDGGATALNTTMTVPFFDFTVATTSNTQFPGRLWNRKWSFATCDITNANFPDLLTSSFTGSYFAYTPDKFIVKVLFQPGFRPLAYQIAMNFTGPNSTGNFPNDRRSVNSNVTVPALNNGYQVFLTTPDATAFPSGAPGNPALTSGIYGCPGAYFLPFYIDQPGDVSILIDLNGTGGYQSGTEDVVLEAYGLAAGNQVMPWNGLNGLGAAVPANFSATVSVTLFQGRTNIPMNDAELNTNGLSITSVFPALGNRKLFWDDSGITSFGTCGPNTDNTTTGGIAHTNLLQGTLGPSHAWDGSNPTTAVPAASGGAGSSTINSLCDDYGNNRCINTWFYAADYASPTATMVVPGCDTDNDGVSNNTDLDDDNDGIPDLVECPSDPLLDADGDGIPNYIDPDFAGFVDIDFDGVNDVFDFDLDGIINSFDLDSDNDGITDLREVGLPDANNNGVIDGFVDSNGNGISDPVDAACPSPTSGQASANAGTSGTVTTPADAIDASATTYATLTSTLAEYDLDFGTLLPAGTVITVRLSSDFFLNTTTGTIQRSANDVAYSQSQAYSTNSATAVAQTYTLGAAARYVRVIVTSGNDTRLYNATYFICNGTAGTQVVPVNTDGTGRANYQDIDSDGDGIVDVIESQTTAGYIAPTGLDSDNDGIDNAFDAISGFGGAGVTPVNTDAADTPDYLDLNSDNDGVVDAIEGWDTDNDNIANTTPAGLDSDGDGLDNAYDVNDVLINPTNGQTPTSFPNNDIPGTAERDWREFDNEPPVAVANSTTTPEDTPVTLNAIQANDTDVDGTVQVSTIDLNPGTAGQQTTFTNAQGNWTVNTTTGNVLFTPVLNFNGTATINYTINDNGGATSNQAALTVTVTPVNDAPVANPNSTTTAEDTPVTLTAIQTNDTDVDGTVQVSTIDLDPATAGQQTTFTNAQGTWTVNTTTGDVLYTPLLNFNGTATINYTINDDGGLTSNQAALTVTVTPVNDAPVANPNSTTTPEDTPVTLTAIQANDMDVDGTVQVGTIDLDPSTAGQQTSITVAGQGTWTVNTTTGDVLFTPALNFNGTATINYTINDNGGLTSNQAALTVNVTPVNDAPVANPNSTTTPEDTPVTLTAIQTNDTDVDGTVQVSTIDLDPATAGQQTSITVVGQGTWTVNTTTGDVLFTPALNFNGTATINYTINDNAGLTSNQAALTVTVTPVNDAPVANPNSTTTNEDTPVTLTAIHANDTDVDGTVQVGTIDLDPATAGQQTTITTVQGTWTVNTTTGDVLYTPAANFNGTAIINYTINDNGGLTSNQAALTVTVNPVNDAPVAVDNTATTPEDTPVTLPNILANDSDVDNTLLASNIDLNPGTAGIQTTFTNAQGTWTVNTITGDVLFTSVLNFNGTASASYQICDGGSPNLCATANLVITVTPVNDAPLAAGDNITTYEDIPVTLTAIQANDSDVDGTVQVGTIDLDPATAGQQTTFTNAQGTWTVNTTTGDVLFTPVLNFNGTATINYTINDNGGLTSNQAALTVTVFPVNDAPVAVDNTIATPEDTPVTLLNILANDSDVDNTLSASNIDLDPATAGIQTTFMNAQGTWTVNATTGDVLFTPILNFNGTASTPYQICDGGSPSLCATANLVVTVTPVNDAPVAVANSASGNAGTPVTIPAIQTNDSDVDGTVQVGTIDLDPSTPGQQTTITVAGQGTWTVNTTTGDVLFTPILGFSGTATINYTINDNGGATSNQAALTITVSPNVSPVANPNSTTTNEDTPVTLTTIQANDTDSDGTVQVSTIDLDPATAGQQTTITTVQGTWTVNTTTGNVLYTPALNFNGTATINYTINDDLGATSNQAALTITVNPVNDAPVANNDNATANEDTPATLTAIQANDTDIDGTVQVGTIDLDPATAGQQTTFTNAQGTWTVNTTTGDVTFTPVLNFNGTATINYTINDNGGLTSNQAALTVTVNPVNDAPVAVDNTITTPEDTPVTLPNILANDSDVDNTLSAANIDLDLGTAGIQTTITVAGQGTWTVNTSTGAVLFTPVLNFNGTASTPYQICDGGTPNLCATANLVITVTPVNDAPVANPNSTTTNEDTPVTLTAIQANDTDVDGTVQVGTIDLDPATAGQQTTVTVAGQGTWTVNTTTGDVLFTPVLNFNGTATINYTINDNGGLTSNQAALTVTVNPVNDAPVAVDNSTTTLEDTPVTLTAIQANDTDVDGTVQVGTIDLDPATAGQQTTFTNAQGTWTVNTTTGDVLFTPVLNFNGTATINYTINDNGGLTSNQAALTVTVTPVNDAPVAVDNSTTLNEDTPATLTAIQANDTDVDGTVQVSTIDLDPATPGQQTTVTTVQGTWTLNTTTGNVVFAPVLNFNGTATINYTINDNGGLTSNQAVLTVTVVPVNDAPVAVDDNTTTNEDTPVTLTAIQANDTDVDGTVQVGTIDLDPATPGQQTTITVAGQGTWTVNTTTGDVTFMPVLNFNGTATIHYTINDNDGALSNQATLTISVASVNDAPVAVDNSTTTNEDTPVTLIAIHANDTDVDGTVQVSTIDLDPATAGQQITFTNAQGIWTVNTSTGNVLYTPALNFNGTATINYTINDNNGATSNQAALIVTVAPVNDAPVAAANNASTNEDTQMVLPAIQANDTDIDGTVQVGTIDLDPATAGQQTTFTNAQGTWSVNTTTGDVTYTPALNFNGTATINYTINDNGGLTSNQAALTVTVAPVNDAPVAADNSGTTNEDTPVTLAAIQANDTDVDGTIQVGTIDLDPATAGQQTTLVTPQGTWTVNTTTGNVTFTPVLNFNGTVTIHYTINDNDGETSNPASLIITVNPVNDAPVANNDNASTNEDTPVTLTAIQANDTDVDGTVQVGTIDLDPATAGQQTTFTNAQGTWTVNTTTGDVLFTPVLNFNGTATANYTIHDDGGATSNQAVLTVSVTPVNDAPVLVDNTATTNEDTPVTLPNILANDSDVDNTLTFSEIDLDPSTAGIQTTLTTVQGTWTLNTSTGDVLFTPVLNFNGTASIPYQVCDNGTPSMCGTANLVITVVSVNDAPVAVANTATTNEDTPVTLPAIQANDTDVDGTVQVGTIDLDPATAGQQTTFTNAQGTWTLNTTTGDVLFTPALNFNGTASINYTINDNGGATSNQAALTVTVDAVNDAPVVDNEFISVSQNGTGSGDLTNAGDSDPDGTTLTATTTPVLDPAHGSIVVNANGTYTYTPTLGYTGTDMVIVSICDAGTPMPALCVNDTIFINVLATTPPVANNDNATGVEDTPLTVNVTTNDTDSDGTINPATVDLDPSTAGIQSTHTDSFGSWSVDASGNVSFTPVLNFNGTATLDYTVNDNIGATSNIGTLSITLSPVNDAPVVDNDVNTISEDGGPATGDLTDAGDSDPDGTALTVTTTPVSGPSNGTIVINADGTYNYTPNANFNGTDVITVQICDAGIPLPAQCVTQTLTITVTPVNDAPASGNENVITVLDTLLNNINVLANNTDIDGDPLTVTANGTSENGGTVVVNPDGTISYIPPTGYLGADTIIYTVCDTAAVPNCVQDTIFVDVQPFLDTDQDGVPDINDVDDDNDGILDTVELATASNSGDSDGDGIPDELDLDSDNDGIPDVIEAGGTDPDGNGTIGGSTFVDTDGDGWSDLVDPTNGGTPLPNEDFDGDGIPDFQDLDSDNDGITDIVESGGKDNNYDGRIDTFNDSNNDGLDDNDAVVNPVDTDGDGHADFIDLDSDNDGIADVIENGGTDANHDGHIDGFADANNDGFDDNTAIANTDPADFDGDGIPNYLDLDADNDGITDATEAGNTDANGDGHIDGFVDANNDGFDDTASATNPVDTDNDGNADYIDLDSDNDGITDLTEAGGTDANGDGRIDTFNDANGDGMDDNDMIADPADTDGDGVADFQDLDSDNDGITDLTEAGGTDTNGNGRIDTFNDANGDGMDDNDMIANPSDTDGDGVADFQDLDSDNDGITDLTEAGGTDANGNGRIDTFNDANGDGMDDNDMIADPADTDGDGVADFQDLDSDNDGITDLTEAGGTDTNGNGRIDTFNDANGDGMDDNDMIADPADTDGDGVSDFQDLDSDNDGITDLIEAGGTDTNGNGRIDTFNDANGDGMDDNDMITNLADTDGDGVPDLQDLDSDNDGITDATEGGNTDANGDGHIDGFVDVNGDGLSDNASNTTPDTDNDGVADFQDLDSDNDGIPDLVEAGGTDANSDGLIDTFNDANGDGMDDNDMITDPADTDNDGNPNYTDPDSDNDGISDVVEAGGTDTNGDGKVDNFTDANGDGMDDNNVITDPVDTDNDGNPDYTDPDSDNDGVSDADENDPSGNGVGPDDTDGDGIPDYTDPDDDNDGILTIDELDEVNGVPGDCDNDGIPNYLDSDPCTTKPTTKLEVPEAFSPNGDGKNDFFVIPGAENLPGNTLVIFNRWGYEVFSSYEYKNTWDGTSTGNMNVDGDQLPTGTYYYVFDTKTEQYGVIKGYVYLKR